MKLSNVAWLSLVLMAGLVCGCRKLPVNPQRVPGYPNTPPIGEVTNSTPINSTDVTSKDKDKDKDAGKVQNDERVNPTSLTDPDVRKTWPRDRSVFKAYTVYFDFDSSSPKHSEDSKIAAVAAYLKAHGSDAVEIEGHCDERGTEEYNRSLGERRALALREALSRQGVSATIIDTVSYGKDKPASSGHTEAAWKKNRRGEFLLEKHP
jgi:peptidoglycan-associated lipoprotein